MKAKYLMRILFLPRDLSMFQTGVSLLDSHQYGGSLWGSTCPVKRGWKIGACSLLERRQLWVVMEMNPDFSQWCMVERQGNSRKLIKERFRCKRKHFRCCPQRLWCLCSCIFSRVGWVKPWTTWCVPIADPTSGRTLDQRPPGVPSNLNCPTILWKLQSNFEIKISKYMPF